MNPNNPELVDMLQSISDADVILQCYNRAAATKFIRECHIKNPELLVATIPGTFRTIDVISDSEIFDQVKLYRNYLVGKAGLKI